MKFLKLLRIAETEHGTFGVLFDEPPEPFAVTVERKWLNNKTGESCIPIGEYTCKKVQSPKFGGTYQVMDVKGRSEILFHIGNIDDDSHGCIIVGENFGRRNGSTAVLSSGNTVGAGFLEFKERLHGHDEFRLLIEKV
mgnify:CR=1 FL=1